MKVVKISPKFQVVIPREIRKALRLFAGQRVQVTAYGNRVELIPVKKISDMRGFLRGMNTRVERERDRL